LGNRIRPGDRVIFDVLGRPIRVHPSRICGACGEIRDFATVCPACGAVSWRRPISTTLTAGAFVGAAFLGWDYLSAPWGAIAYWAGVVLGGCWALGALTLWYQALQGVGIHCFRLVGGALLFGGIGWLIDWWTVGRLDTWAVVGAASGAALELIAGQIYYWKDSRR
jgi:hypothetical protein